jgi:predicted dehydrogenase
MNKLRTAVIGAGYLGKFHAEKLATLPTSDLMAIVDVDETTARRVAHRWHIDALTDYRQLLGRVDAVSIAVPTQRHFGIARDFLENGAHVLLEKPITTTLEEAQGLIEAAARHGRVLQIGHLERFNPAILALEGRITQPLFIESHRLAPFKPRGIDVSVVLDLMIHDIDIILNMVKSPVRRIDASGAPVLSSDIDIANARIQFENRCVANVTASRVSLKAERKMRLFQPDTYLSIDFQNRALAIYRKGEDRQDSGFPEIMGEQRTFEESDALKSEIADFLEAALDGRSPRVSGEDGKQALATAIEISRQLTGNSPPELG